MDGQIAPLLCCCALERGFLDNELVLAVTLQNVAWIQGVGNLQQQPEGLRQSAGCAQA